MSVIAIDTYFERIGKISNPLTPSETLLNQLIFQHVTHIPFEALDIHFGRMPNVSDINVIHNKLVTQQRGGWCYEMNGLFFYVLKALGFEPTFHLASVYEGKWLDPSHAFITVPLNNKRYLVDVGFGNLGLSKAIELGNHVGTMPNGLHYQVEHTDDQQYIYSAGFNHALRPQYRFDLNQDKELSLADFIPHNEFFATSPESPFTQAAIVKIITPNGFVKLIDRQLTYYKNQNGKLVKESTRTLKDQAEYQQILITEFNLDSASLT